MPLSHHHILFAVLGRTPQILTETLYALCVLRRIPIHEVWAVSTHEGRQDAIQKLLDPVHGQLYQLQQDYPAACGQVRFAPENIIVAEDHLMPIPDIRTRQHSETFLELILRELWKKTADPNLVLHCSLAGGRKTMSTYLALALQLLARPQDALYHVLVDPPELEHHGGFYYPPPRATPIVLGDGRTLDAGDAHIDLIDIPFIRLRERMQIDPNQSPAGYRQLLEWVQSNLDQSLVLPQLLLDVKKHALRIGKSEIFLQPQRFCLYWYFAGRSHNRPRHVQVEDYHAYFEPAQSPYFSVALREGLLQRFDRLDPSGQMRASFVEKVLEKGELPMSWVLQTRARINSQIRRELLPSYLVPFYMISAEGKRGRKCYGIKLDGQKISIMEAVPG
ncbi:TIGR02584 family CRISPR-associated protein [candidate division KSB1 bacterium]|nr:TIGR02584 family CRISPR-associated protein [candidate division KSB1 bacterium]